MSSSYSTSLLLELIGTGEQAGNWGATTNKNLGTLLEQAITGVITITMGNADYTLTNLQGASDEARNAVIVVSGTGPTSSTRKKVIAPVGTGVTKTYTVFNNTSAGYPITFGGSTGTAVTIPNGTAALVYGDGVSFYNITNSNNVTGNLTLNSGSLYATQPVASISSASPAVVTISSTSSGLLVNSPIFFTLGDAAVMPTGLTANTVYYVTNIAVSGSTTFNVSATPGGSAINTSTANVGVINVVNSPFVSSVNGQAGNVSVAQLNGLSVVADGSNNLNISLSPTTLSFRSATSSSGAITTVTTTAATTLTVPSGATLGTLTAGTPCTIAILAFYSSGSVILGVQNIWGNFIDEGQLKSATAISTSSDDTNAYSSSTVTSVPYRVVGYFYYSSAPIPIGTWSSNPTTVQSAGGLILTQGLGMGTQAWSASSNSINTVLRNSNPFPICVAVACSATFYVAVGPSTPTITVAGSATGGANDVVNFIVPPGNTFEIFAAGGTSVLTYSVLS